MNESESQHGLDEPRAPAPPPDDDGRNADEDFSQWVLLVVLLACWLAEASL